MSDLQFSKASGASPSFTMVHKMGLVKLNPTTKSVSNKLTYTYNQANGSYTSDPTGTATVTASNDFTGNKPYSSSGYWHIIKATTASTNTAMAFTCNANQKDFWSEKSSGTDVGYGKYKTIDIQSDRTAANFEALFSYVGTCQTITLPWYDNYKLECWGAQGGYSGGNGGYTAGSANLSGVLYVYVGGQGSGNNTHVAVSGGYNGGGSANSNQDGNVRTASGGGATHIATRQGLLSALYTYRTTSILIVAGGGGGKGGNVAIMYCKGGNGGGGNNSGTNGDTYKENSYYATGNGGGLSGGGTYSSNLPASYGSGAGSFGQGGSSPGTGAGGGYWGGGAACYSAGGGSGYLNTAIVTLTAATTGNRSGNGYAKITSQ